MAANLTREQTFEFARHLRPLVKVFAAPGGKPADMGNTLWGCNRRSTNEEPMPEPTQVMMEFKPHESPSSPKENPVPDTPKLSGTSSPEPLKDGTQSSTSSAESATSAISVTRCEPSGEVGETNEVTDKTLEDKSGTQDSEHQPATHQLDGESSGIAGHGKGGSSPIDREIQELQTTTSQLVSVVKSTNAYVEERLPAIEGRVHSLEAYLGNEMQKGFDRFKNEILSALASSSQQQQPPSSMQTEIGFKDMRGPDPGARSIATLTNSSLPDYLTKGTVLPKEFLDFPVLPMGIVIDNAPASILSAICSDRFIVYLLDRMGVKPGMGTAHETLMTLEDKIINQEPRKEELLRMLDRIKFFIYSEKIAMASKDKIETKVNPSAKVAAKKTVAFTPGASSEAREKLQKQMTSMVFRSPKWERTSWYPATATCCLALMDTRHMCS